VASPSDDRSIGFERDGVASARGDGRDEPDSQGRGALSELVVSPSDDRSIGFERDGEAYPRGDGIDDPDSWWRGALSELVVSPRDDRFIGAHSPRPRQSRDGGEQQDRAARPRGASSGRAISAMVVTGESQF
jgi:hypothetical protein